MIDVEQRNQRRM